MTGRGNLTYAPTRRMRLMVIAHVVWLSLVCILGAWWGRLVLRQAARIAELETARGMAQSAQLQWLRTQRMVYWESSTYYGLLLAATGLLFWLYWRDVRRSRGIEAFFASVTHELRTPLTSIRLQAESIAESVSDPSQQALLQRLLEDTMRLESQVERTLELARVEGGGPVLRQPLELKPWLDRFIEIWRSARPGQVDFELDIADVIVETDPGALQVILKNLIENSIRHSREAKVKIAIRAVQHPRGLALEVRDNGPGYGGDPHELGQLFRKGAGSQGAGVGLYLVRMLMNRMGGSAEFFVANPGFGVTLWFLQPDMKKAVAHG